MSYTLLNINLADLTAIKITCAQCRASAEFPVARLQGDPPERCFHCRAEWFVAKSSQATALEHLFRALGELRGDAASGCRVQLVMMPADGVSAHPSQPSVCAHVFRHGASVMPRQRVWFQGHPPLR